jgi:hypothetical protein
VIAEKRGVVEAHHVGESGRLISGNRSAPTFPAIGRALLKSLVTPSLTGDASYFASFFQSVNELS